MWFKHKKNKNTNSVISIILSHFHTLVVIVVYKINCRYELIIIFLYFLLFSGHLIYIVMIHLFEGAIGVFPPKRFLENVMFYCVIVYKYLYLYFKCLITYT